MDRNKKKTPLPPPTPPPQPPRSSPLPEPQPPVPPVTVPPSPPPPPTVTASIPSSSKQRKKRSKALRIDTPCPLQSLAPPSSSSPLPETPPSVPPFIIRLPLPPPSPSKHRNKQSKPLSIGPPRRKYTVRTTQPIGFPECPECDKLFLSRKALYGHMRCHPNREYRGMKRPPHLNPPSVDERDVANSLLLLGSSLSAGASGSSGGTGAGGSGNDHIFECASCKKTFPTHQALGGHRASHKNVKGCFAITKGGGVYEHGSTSGTMERQNGNSAHRCGICNKEFSNGQALGGHMRYHGLGPSPIPQPEDQVRVGFDLNQPAQVTEDVGPCDSSSSSTDLELDLRL